MLAVKCEVKRLDFWQPHTCSVDFRSIPFPTLNMRILCEFPFKLFSHTHGQRKQPYHIRRQKRGHMSIPHLWSNTIIKYLSDRSRESTDFPLSTLWPGPEFSYFSSKLVVGLPDFENTMCVEPTCNMNVITVWQWHPSSINRPTERRKKQKNRIEKRRFALLLLLIFDNCHTLRSLSK